MQQSIQPRIFKRILYMLLILLLLLSTIFTKSALAGSTGSGVWTLVAQRGSCFTAAMDDDTYQPIENAHITLVDWDTPFNAGGRTLTLKPGEMKLRDQDLPEFALTFVLVHTVPESMNAGEYVSLECADYYTRGNGEKQYFDNLIKNNHPLFYYTYQLGGFLPDSIDLIDAVSGGAGNVFRGFGSVSSDGFTVPEGSAAGDELTVRAMLRTGMIDQRLCCIEYLYVWTPHTAGAPIEEEQTPADEPYYDTDGIDGIEDTSSDELFSDYDETDNGISPIAVLALSVGVITVLGGIIAAIVKAMNAKRAAAASAVAAGSARKRVSQSHQSQPANTHTPAQQPMQVDISLGAADYLGGPGDNPYTSFEDATTCKLS